MIIRILIVVLFITLGIFIKGERESNPDIYPASPGKGHQVYVIDHGLHAGLILPVAFITASPGQYPQLATMLAYTPDAAWLEIGWGDKGFYQNGSFDRISLSMMARAMFIPTPSVIHAVGFIPVPPAAFPHSDMVSLRLSETGLKAMLIDIEATLDIQPGITPLPGLYGDSRFFRANGNYHMFQICNHRIAQWLSAAGVPVNISLASWPGLLRMDLISRAGAQACVKGSANCAGPLQLRGGK